VSEFMHAAMSMPKAEMKPPQYDLRDNTGR
jgi:hypothetical protein